MDRYMNRFIGIDDRLREIEQMLGELPSRFEALERSDEKIGSETDAIEEWLVLRQLAAMENVLEEVRKRRAERASALGKQSPASSSSASAPGSVYNPAGLLRSMRECKTTFQERAGQVGGRG